MAERYPRPRMSHKRTAAHHGIPPVLERCARCYRWRVCFDGTDGLRRCLDCMRVAPTLR
jgi:hypothetical protein